MVARGNSFPITVCEFECGEDDALQPSGWCDALLRTCTTLKLLAVVALPWMLSRTRLDYRAEAFSTNAF